MSGSTPPGPAGRTLVDEEERRRARSAFDTCMCVEAAAGTGKTTLIVDRIEGLLRSGRARPSEIAAITFTELAAAELKSRLRQRLAGCDPELALQLEAAQISTIHSLALTILRERPLEAGLHPGFETLDPARAEELFDELWREWLERQVPAPGATPDPAARGERMLRLALQVGLDVGALREAARLLYDHRDVVLDRPAGVGPAAAAGDPPADPEPAAVKLGETAARLGEEARKLCEQLEAALAPSGALDTQRVKAGDRLATAIEALRQFLRDHPHAARPPQAGEGADELVHLGRLWAWARTLSGAPGLAKSPNVGAQGNWPSKHALAEARRCLQEIQEGLEGLVSAAGQAVAEALVGWLAEFVRFAQEEKRQRGVVDFLDQLLRCRDLLRDEPAVREHFQHRWRYVVVDEFQDTDPLQTEIVFYLAERRPSAGHWEDVALGPGRLFVVGDPKQSIYRFRRADVEMYEKAAGRLEKQGERRTIRQNFRTLPAVAAWVNRVFGALMVPDGASAIQPRYVPIEPFRPDPDGEWEGEGVVPPGVYRLEPAPDGAAGPDAGRRRVAELREAEAQAMAAAIRELVEGRRLRVYDPEAGAWRAAGYGDVAILLPVFTDLEVYEDALRAFGVPFRVVGGRLFFERSEVRELVALLSAVDNPSDGMAVVGALRSGFFGVGDDELVRWAHEADWASSGLAVASGRPLPEAAARAAPSVASALERIGRWHRELSRLSPQQAVRRLLDETGYEAFLGLHPSGQQALANLAKIEAQAAAMGQAGVSFHGFVRWLRRRGPQGPAAAEEEDAALSGSDDEAVRVMTVHKAKGLEFPVAFVANLFGESLQVERAVVDRARGRVELQLGSSELRLKTRGYDEAAQMEKARLEAERLRLYYVAMTRARDYLVVSAAGLDGGFWKRVASACPQALEQLPPLPVEPAEVAGGTEEGEVAGEEPGGAEGFEAAREAWRRGREELLRRASEGLRVEPARGGAAAPAQPLAEKPTPDGTNPELVEDGDAPLDHDGTAVGQVFHVVMERAAARRLDVDEAWIERQLAYAADTYGLSPHDRALVRGWLVAACSPQGELRQRAAAADAWMAEVPFAYEEGSVIREGRIDVVGRGPGGSVWAIDYKTDDLDLPELIERYAHQAAAYADGLARASGVPVEVFLYSARRAKLVPAAASRGIPQQAATAG